MKTDSPFANRVRVRSCAIVVRDDHLLLVKQHVPTRDHPIWLIPGGLVKLQESCAAAAMRELREETGIEAESPRLRYLHEFRQPPFHAIEFYFVAGYRSGTPSIGTDPEFRSADQPFLDSRFIPLAEAAALELHPTFLKNDIQNGTLLTNRVDHHQSDAPIS
ncbi:MAG: NUDIX domain-containing protein [Balneolaceae bacterium]